MINIIQLKNVQLSFPCLKAPNEKGKYQTNLLFERASEAYSTLAAVQANVKGRKPLRNGDDKAEYAGYADHYFCTVKSNYAPKLFNEQNLPCSADQFKTGCVVNAALRPYEYEKDGNKGMGLSLIALQFVKMGSLGSESANFDASTLFEALPGSEACAPMPDDNDHFPF